jgi:hypothetical protein
MYRGIEALLVIHNICVELRDVDDIDQVNPIDDQLATQEQAMVVNNDQGRLRAAELACCKQRVEYWGLYA